MYLKAINNVEGYKDLPDGFNAEFDESITYIIGANFQRKTTVGSLFNWCLTGRTLLGNEKESVANDKKDISNVLVDITFVDNNGIEHRLIRNKSKVTNLILDGKQIEQGVLAQFYADRDVFLAAYNPYYFFSLKPQEQRELLGKIIPPISSEKAFELLNEEEKKILKYPIDNLNVYTDDRNKELHELEKEYTINVGSLKAIREVALKQEVEFLTFDKEIELEQKMDKYKMLENSSNENIEELKMKNTTIDKRLNELFNVKLKEITTKFNCENEKLKKINNEKPICSTCKQEIKDTEMIKHLKSSYLKILVELQNKSNELKKDANFLTNKKKENLELIEKMSSPDIQKIEDEKKKLKIEIQKLQEEQQRVIIHNNKVQALVDEVKNAKNNISIIEKAQQEILEKQEKCKKQKDIANKLKILIIDKQKEEIQKHLNKVDIQFSKIRKSDNNIVECCIINYENREYRKLSKSQQARTNLEISNLFNKLSRIQAPIFFDDAESTTDIDDVSNTQMIISLVVKDTPLEILYDYNDVLLRKQMSIEKEIENESNYMIEKVA